MFLLKLRAIEEGSLPLQSFPWMPLPGNPAASWCQWRPEDAGPSGPKHFLPTQFLQAPGKESKWWFSTIQIRSTITVPLPYFHSRHIRVLGCWNNGTETWPRTEKKSLPPLSSPKPEERKHPGSGRVFYVFPRFHSLSLAPILPALATQETAAARIKKKVSYCADGSSRWWSKFWVNSMKGSPFTLQTGHQRPNETSVTETVWQLAACSRPDGMEESRVCG